MNFEKISSEEEENQNVGPEQEQNPELISEIKELDQNAEMVGEQLENVDPEKLTPEDNQKLEEIIARVSGAFYMLVGVAATTNAWMAFDDPGHQGSIEKALAVALGIGSYSIVLKGFGKLISGTKKFWTERDPELKTEVQN